MEPTEPIEPAAASGVHALSASLSELVAESQALRTDVRTAEATRRKENRINLVVIIMLTLFVVLVLVVAWQNNRIAAETRTTNDRIADCTTAGGRCYEDGKQRTGAAIGNIIQAEIALGECSRLYPGESGPAFDQKLKACVYSRIQPSPTPSPTR